MTAPTLIERLKTIVHDNIFGLTPDEEETVLEAIAALSSPPTNAEKDAATYDALLRLDVSSPPSLDLRAEAQSIKREMREELGKDVHRSRRQSGLIVGWLKRLDAALKESR